MDVGLRAGACLAALAMAMACAAAQKESGHNDAPPNKGATKTQLDSDPGPVPNTCKLPKRSQPVNYAEYTTALCPKDSYQTIVAHSEGEYLAKLACMAADGAPVPSGIDWQANELLFVRAWYQGDPGRIVRALDTPDGRVVQLYQSTYCGGAAPMEGETTWALLMPQRGAGEVTMIGCERQPCGWELGGGPPPA